MSRIFIGLVLDAPLPDGLSNARLVRAVRTLLDFLYLAQHPVHTELQCGTASSLCEWIHQH